MKSWIIKIYITKKLKLLVEIESMSMSVGHRGREKNEVMGTNNRKRKQNMANTTKQTAKSTIGNRRAAANWGGRTARGTACIERRVRALGSTVKGF